MIEPFNTVTANVSEELSRIAGENGVSTSKLYVEIKSTTTFSKVNNTDFIDISNDIDKYTDEDALRNKTLEFKQEHDILIQSKSEDYPFNGMFCDIILEEKNTLGYLVIKRGSRLHYSPDLYKDFSNYIAEKMIKSNIMLYLFDTDYKDSIKQFVNLIEKIKVLTFKEDKKILVSKGLLEIKAIEADMSMTIEENKDNNPENSEERIDYADRGFLLNCKVGDQLFEFVKPQQGKYGRTCTGEIIEVETISLDAKPTFTVDDNIEIQDSFENIKYLATRSGYVVKTGSQYEVSNSIDVGEISFKTTGTIDSDLDTEITINVVKDDPLEDAIEEGMHVKVQNLAITGSIGPGTHVEARTVSITGQTHHESSIQCINANIKIHKGKITGRKVEVTTLDGGEIIADTAIITNAISGKIRAKTIEISRLGSHVIMEASEIIQIDTVKGEENQFIFQSSIDSGFNENKEDNEKYLIKLKDALSISMQAFKAATVKLKKNLEPCAKIKAAIINMKNENSKIPDDLMKKFKMCKVMKINYKKLKEEVEYKKSQYIKEEKNSSTNIASIRDAKIVLNESLHGYNYIKYKLDKPKVDIELRTEDNMRKKTFRLIEDDEGISRIVNM